MKRLIFLFIVMSTFIALNAQDISISFQPKDAGTKIDSVWVTNLKTDQKVKLLGNESLVLSQSTGNKSLASIKESGYLYPNPCYGDASLVFSTSVNQEVEVRIYSISGQVLDLIRQELSPGQHTFKVKFPVIGLYAAYVLKDDEPLSFKAVYSGVQMQECKIEYAGSGSPDQLKSAVVEKTLSYKQGDILLYSIFSAKNNTIITDSPSATKVYSVKFYECIDFDKNYYKIVKIGSQVWMAENLKTTKYRDGAAIPNVTGKSEWAALTTGAYCWYNNDPVNKVTYGALYNRYAVNTGKLCPAGWHVPSDAEWEQLAKFISDQKGPYNGYETGWENVGKHLKATGTIKDNDGLWNFFNSSVEGSDDFGFSGLPGGARNYDGTFLSIGRYGIWWSSTDIGVALAWFRLLTYDGTYLSRDYFSYEEDGFSVRCLRDENANTPTVTTSTPVSVTTSSVILGGTVSSDGGNTVIERGVCYNTSQNPTTADNKMTMGSGTGSFSNTVTGLAADTTYYVRAYATNSNGTAYGEERVIKTMKGTLDDSDGNNYYTITIGSQEWMAENLKTTKYRDGAGIPNVTDNTSWASLTSGAYCWYNNDIGNKATYGALYNWYAVNTGKLCPTGWHVPSDAEWTTLSTYLGGESVAGGKMKETGTAHWLSPNTGATNESGFSGLPDGSRLSSGSFPSVGSYGTWWSSSEFSTNYAWCRALGYDSPVVYRSGGYEGGGFSVRCLRD